MSEVDNAYNEGTPLEASTAAIKQAPSLLGTDDEVGLWTFSARDRLHSTIGKLFNVGPLDVPVNGQSRRSRLMNPNVTVDPLAGYSPLYGVIDQGLDELARDRAGPSRDIVALVVITDGRRRNLAGETLAGLLSRLNSAGSPARSIQVYVLAFHDRDVCTDLSATLDATVGGGHCQATTAGRVTNDLRKLLAGLWKGTGQ